MKRQLLSLLGICVFCVTLLSISVSDCFAQTFLPEPEDCHDISDENTDFVARITGEHEMQWDGDMGPPLHATMAAGERLNLAEGLIEITFNNGAVIVLEGPAEFVIDSPGSGTLEIGKLTAHIPERAIGFVVDTPSVRIVDLGSQFGVMVDEDGVTSLNMFEGEARAEVIDATTGRVVKTVMLREGTSVRIDEQNTVITSETAQPDRAPPAEGDQSGNNNDDN